MAFSSLLSQFLDLSSPINKRFAYELSEYCCHYRRNANEYFDFYLDENEDSSMLANYINSFNFDTEVLSFPDHTIHRQNMSSCYLPAETLLRVYNTNCS